MMYDTSVTIVILSPNMKESKWIDWEIEYCLKDITRKDRTSHTNGVVAVIMKVDNSYEWFKKSGTNCHGSSTVSYELDKVFDIISQNHFNSNPEQWHCDKCKTYDWLNGSYITFVEEETFLDDPEKYSTYFLKIDNVKFRQKVVPGDTLIFRVELMAPIRRGISTMKGYIFVGEKIVCEAEFMAQIVKNK